MDIAKLAKFLPILQYVRVAVDTPMSDMLDFLVKVWNLDLPNLLISVTGTAKNFPMSKHLRDTFNRGLMKTALTSGKFLNFMKV